MALHRTEPVGEHYDTNTARTWDPSIILRVIGAIAAGVMTVIGLVAVAKISWGDNGFDAPAVNVAGMMFTPEVAVVTAAAGVIALIAAAMRDLTSKLIVGGLLIVGGVVILLTDSTDVRGNWVFENGHGWLAIGVGATLVVIGLLMQAAWTTGRRVSHRDPVMS